MYKTIQNSTPWLILAGSGGVADILVTLINQVNWDTDFVQELLIETFPNGQSASIASWTKLVSAQCLKKFVFALNKLLLRCTNQLYNIVEFFFH